MGKISTRLIRKGPLIDETRVALAQWDLDTNSADNFARFRADNPFGARTEGWLDEIVRTVATRLSVLPDAQITSLVLLARSAASREVWSAALLWHESRANEIYAHFATDWLYPRFQNGSYLLRTQDLVPFVEDFFKKRQEGQSSLSHYGNLRAARDLLRIATDFGLLQGGGSKQFSSYHLPEDAFVYVLQSMAETEQNARKIIHSSTWRIFLMDFADVESELLRLHQFRRLHYDVAGSLVQLRLPYKSAADYARGMVTT